MKHFPLIRSALRAGCVAGLLCAAALTVYGQGNVFKHIRYNGGTFHTKVSPKDWRNRLTVTSDVITFKLKDDQEIQIESKLVTALSYGQDANHSYLIGIQYTSPKGEKAGLLLQGDKNNYAAILAALQSVTSLPIETNENNRDSVPSGLTTKSNVINETRAGANSGQSAPAASSAEYGNIVVTSDPPEADVYVDGAYVGITPAALDLIDGKHMVRVSHQGYTDWSREISVILRSRVNLAATLAKQN